MTPAALPWRIRCDNISGAATVLLSHDSATRTRLLSFMSERRVNSGTAEQKRLPEVASSIARQLPLPPVMELTVRIELANVGGVRCPNDADPRKLCRRVRCSTRSLINPFRQTDRERGPVTSRPHDGKANPHRFPKRPAGAADGWPEARGARTEDLGVTPRTRATIEARDFGFGKLK